MLRGHLLARLVALTVVAVFAFAASVAGIPSRCLLDQHCGMCEEVAGPAIGLGGCSQMTAATPGSPDQSPITFVALVAPAPAPAVAVFAKPMMVSSFRPAVAAFPDGAPPGGLALRI